MDGGTGRREALRGERDGEGVLIWRGPYVGSEVVMSLPPLQPQPPAKPPPNGSRRNRTTGTGRQLSSGSSAAVPSSVTNSKSGTYTGFTTSEFEDTSTWSGARTPASHLGRSTRDYVSAQRLPATPRWHDSTAAFSSRSLPEPRMARKFLFTERNEGLQQLPVMKHYTIMLEPEDGVEVTNDHLSYRYVDFLTLQSQPQFELSHRDGQVDVHELAEWLHKARPHTRLDGYPLFLLARDLLRKLLRKELQFMNSAEDALRKQLADVTRQLAQAVERSFRAEQEAAARLVALRQHMQQQLDAASKLAEEAAGQQAALQLELKHQATQLKEHEERRLAAEEAAEIAAAARLTAEKHAASAVREREQARQEMQAARARQTESKESGRMAASRGQKSTAEAPAERAARPMQQDGAGTVVVGVEGVPAADREGHHGAATLASGAATSTQHRHAHGTATLGPGPTSGAVANTEATAAAAVHHGVATATAGDGGVANCATVDGSDGGADRCGAGDTLTQFRELLAACADGERHALLEILLGPEGLRDALRCDALVNDLDARARRGVLEILVAQQSEGAEWAEPAVGGATTAGQLDKLREQASMSGKLHEHNVKLQAELDKFRKQLMDQAREMATLHEEHDTLRDDHAHLQSREAAQASEGVACALADVQTQTDFSADGEGAAGGGVDDAGKAVSDAAGKAARDDAAGDSAGSASDGVAGTGDETVAGAAGAPRKTLRGVAVFLCVDKHSAMLKRSQIFASTHMRNVGRWNCAYFASRYLHASQMPCAQIHEQRCQIH